MKKLIAYVLCVVLVFACGVSVLGAQEKQVVFSLSKVSGKAGDLVFVDLSLLTPNTEIGAMELQFAYDDQKLEPAPHPESEEGSCFIQGKGFFEDSQNTALIFSEIDLKMSLVDANGLDGVGVLGTLAFTLKENVETSASLVAVRCNVAIHYADQTTYTFSYENNCDYAQFKFDEQGDNYQKEITLNLKNVSVDAGKLAYMTLSIEEGKSYIKEFEIRLSYDAKNLQLIGFRPGALLDHYLNTYEFNAVTATLKIKLHEPLLQKGDFGQFVFQVMDVSPTSLPFAVTGEVIGNPVHGKIDGFVYEPTVNGGSITVLYSEFFYEKGENGVVLVGYEGNDYNITIPAFVDGVPVVEIGEKAFFNCQGLQVVRITNYITKIADNAFDGCSKTLNFHCGADSVAEIFAKANGFKCSNFVSAEIVTSTDAFALGDLNKDTMINAKDALLVLQIAVQKYQPSAPAQVVAGDVNKDEKANAKDALEILKKAVGKPACF